MKKHFLFFSSIIVLIVVLSACGSKPDNTAAPVASSAPADSSTPVASSTPVVSSTPAKVHEVQEVNLIASAETFKFDKSEYKVKKGIPVNLTLQNKDGVHGAYIGEFGVNLKSVDSNDGPETTFTPDKTGTFVIKCAVPCGTGHMTMTANLIVE